MATRDLPPDELIVAHADDLQTLALDCGVPRVLLVKRLLQLADDPGARERWPVVLGRVSRLREVRRQARSRPVPWR